MIYSFTLILEVTPQEPFDELAEKVYEKIEDALLYSCNGVIGLDFDRKAKSLESAVQSAIQDLEKAGFKARYIEDCPEASPEYWEKLMEKLRGLPDAIEAEGEDPEPFM